MTCRHYLLFVALLCPFLAPPSVWSQTDDRTLDLGQPRAPGAREYRFTTVYLTYIGDGSLWSREETSTRLEIRLDETGRQTLTAREFELVGPDGSRHTIPSLAGWTNVIDHAADELLGVSFSDFAGLTTDEGEPLSPEIAHRVYNTFIDFYAFHNVFAEPSAEQDQDIGDLKSIGQVIEHYSSYSRPEVPVGGDEGASYFQNGRVTLEWKGMSRIGDRACALVGFDSGESDFRMAMEPAPGMPMTVKGGSQYWGDLYIDAETLWLERADFIEVVISRVEFGDNPPADRVIKRLGRIETVD